jgi:hypothetical protein
VTGPTAEIQVRQVLPQMSAGCSLRHSNRIDETLELSVVAPPAMADAHIQASQRPPSAFRITLALSHPDLSTVVRMHRRLMSLLRKQEIGPAPKRGAVTSVTTTLLRQD